MTRPTSMATRFQPPALPLLVLTDLDGTLLDHDSYSFAAARPALDRLRSLAVPVVPVTSKTLAELEELIDTLGLDGPCIAENGGLLAYPAGYFPPAGQTDSSRSGRFEVEYLSPSYRQILEDLRQLRSRYGFRFSGFADLDDAEVAGLTGLDHQQAKRARARSCSEPLVWEDTTAAFDRFTRELTAKGYRLVKGGRFTHVLGNTDKAAAINRLAEHYRRSGFSGFTRIVLGDSPNDAGMLAMADIAVIVRRKDGSWLEVACRGECIKTRNSGPAGWNEFFQDYFARTAPPGGLRTRHG